MSDVLLALLFALAFLAFFVVCGLVDYGRYYGCGLP